MTDYTTLVLVDAPDSSTVVVDDGEAPVSIVAVVDDAVVIVETGMIGETGPPGPPGPIGGTFVHDQTVAAAVWGPITHGLGFYPACTVVDDSGRQIFPTVDHISTTQALITHSIPYAGEAYFS